jgi:hypothetical protein
MLPHSTALDPMASPQLRETTVSSKRAELYQGQYLSLVLTSEVYAVCKDLVRQDHYRIISYWVPFVGLYRYNPPRVV